MRYGQVYRAVPRVNVLRGFYGNESQAFSISAKIANSMTIQSGMVISLNATHNWEVGCPNGRVPYIAFEDGATSSAGVLDSSKSDTDVLSSGLLLGLSCSGDYEIQTCWVDSTATYNENTALAAGLDLTHSGGADQRGKLVPVTSLATSQQDIVGFVTRSTGSNGGKQTLGPVVSGVANAGTNSQVDPAVNATAVTFVTKWLPYRGTTTSTTTTS